MHTEGAHPIEIESYRIMRERLDFSDRPAGDRDVVERMVHATADESFHATARVGELFVAETIRALLSGSLVICDSEMVAAGVPSVRRRNQVRCYLAGARADGQRTRSAGAVELAARDHPRGAIWVIGNAPTALDRLLDLIDSGDVSPASVVGLPVGYVGAAEAKARLWQSGVRRFSVTNEGPRGGSPVAAAALNAVARLAWS